ncbi:MAG: delta-60 repeat domain-containing protein [Flavobacteriales bacterium]|nr:MAG: delta-60 repeat domain-containing protein [Flavobacteriales bacterium]
MLFSSLPLRALLGAALTGAALCAQAQTNPSPRSLPFTEAFPSGTFNTYPSGFQGWNGVNGGSTTTLALAAASTPTGNATLTAAAPTAGGTAGLFGTSGRIAVNTSGNATNGVNQLMMAFDATSYADITLEYAVYSQLAQPRTIGVVCQYRVGTSGGWTSISPTSGSNPYSQAGAVGTGLKTTVSATLPAACNYQPVVQVRWAIWRGTETGNSSALAFDDITVDGTLDSDQDGTPDDTDPCPYLANLVPGNACDDGNPGTVNDEVNNSCVCQGIFVSDECNVATWLGAAQPTLSCSATLGSSEGATSSGPLGCTGGTPADVWYYSYATNPQGVAFIDLVPGTAAGLGVEVRDIDCDGAVTYCGTGNSHTLSVQPGQYFWFRVFTSTPGTFTVCVREPMGNDECAQSAYLGSAQPYGSCTPTAGSTVGLTASGGACSASANDAWYYVGASGSSSTFVDLVPGTAGGMGIEVIEWDGCVNANSIYCASGNSHTVPMLPSQTYAIRVFTATPGSFTICVSAPQANDDCAGAVYIDNNEAANCPANAVTGTTSGTTPSGGACGAANADAWYYFYSGTSLSAQVDLGALTAAGLGIEVVEASCAGSSIYCAAGTSHAVPVTPAQYYYLRIFSSTPGDFTVCVSSIVQPGNDDCAGSTYLGGAQPFGSCSATSGTTIGASASGGACSASANDVWYYVSASGSSSTFVDLVPGTAGGLGIEVIEWDGCVNANSIYCASGNSHTVPMLPSQTYAIRVFTATPGSFTICVSAPQTNDDCAGAVYIDNNEAANCPANAVTGTTSGTTPSGGACGAANADAWYYFYSGTSLSAQVDLGALTAAGLGIEVVEASCAGSSIYCAAGTSHAVPVTPAQYYYLRIFSSTPGDFTVCVSSIVQPGNDDCANSTYLGGAQPFGACSATSGTTIGASASGGACSATANDVWYYVYASGSSSTFVDLVPGTAGGLGIEVIEWDGCVNANSIYCASGNSHTVPMLPSQLYAIRVFTATPGSFTICVSAPQTNDDCAGAVYIDNNEAANCPANAVTGTTSGTTPSGGACGAANADAWYYFYSGTSLSAQVDLGALTAAGLGIEVVEASCGGSSIYCAAGTSHAVPVTPGQNYYLRIFSSTPGDFTVCVSSIVQPGNDDCANSTYLGGAQPFGSCSATSGTTLGASASGGACSASANDVWYYVSASGSSSTFVDLVPGTAGGMGIEVIEWDGCVNANSIYCASGNSHTVPMVPSQLYAIRVFTATPGSFTICVSAPPSNDDCSNATGLGLYNYADCPVNATPGTTAGATPSGTNSCSAGATQDVWYSAYSSSGSSIFIHLGDVTATGIGIEVFDACGGAPVYCAMGTAHTVPTAINANYVIKVFSTTPGDFTICASTPVYNNECDFAAGLSLYNYADCPVNATPGTTTGSTQSGANSCNGGATYDVWYTVGSGTGSSLFVNLGDVTATGIGIEVFDACGGTPVYCANGAAHTVPTTLYTTYYIKVFSTAPGDFSICASTPVYNNECDFATGLGLYNYADCPVNATPGTTTGSTQSGANSCAPGAVHDVWYTVGSGSGSAIFVNLGDVTAAGIGIEVFDACGSTPVYCGNGTTHTVPTTLNTTYFIKVFSTAPGDFTICASTPVYNNECDFAAGLGLYNYTDCPVNATPGTTAGSTQSGANSCAPGAVHDVWYTVGSGSGSALFVNLGDVTAAGIGIEVFDACGGTPVYCATGTAHTVPTTLYTTYSIKVFSTAPGDFTICASTPVANNECDFATVLGVFNDGDCPANANPGTTAGSTQSGANGCNGSASYDVWYVLYSGSAAAIEVSIAELGATGTGIEVFDGCPGSAVYCGSGTSHTVSVAPFQNYYVKVFSSGAGGFSICANYPPPVFDCLGVLGGSALPGTPCNDNNACTTGDTWNPSCQCVGTPLPDSDNDGLCDAQDSCPLVPGTVGSPCDDNDPCTLNDALGADCLCVGTSAPDSDGDGTCDGLDACPYLADLNNGDPCDDGNPATIGDVVSGCTCSGTVSSGGVTLAANWPLVNGLVRALAHDTINDIVYLGGSFTRLGPAVPYGARVNTTDGAYDPAFPAPNGPVEVAVPDGAGGWYIGGFFTRIGGVERNRAARINADGSLHPWNPNASWGVNAIVVSGSTVYLGGAFSTVGGQPRARLAAVDATTGVPTSWNPGATGSSVLSLALDGTTLYVGGFLTSVAGQPRTNAGAVSTVTGAATAWDPAPNEAVLTMLAAGGVVYAGGQFTSIGGQPRTALAALNSTTGAATSWDPGVVGSGGFASVNALALHGGNLLVGGQYYQIGGNFRMGIALVSTTTATSTPWNANLLGGVLDLSVSGNSAYLVGNIASIGGQQRQNAVEVDLTSGAVTAWDPAPGASLSAVCRSGSAVYIGGTFATLGGAVRNNLAAIDAATGAVLPWNPNVQHTSFPDVYDIHLSGDSLVYVAGQFNAVGGQPRQHLAALRTSDGTATGWAPAASSLASAIVRSGNQVYVGGSFTTLAGQSRERIACVDAATGVPTAWNPGANGSVLDFALHGDTLYAGGAFTTIGGAPRSRLAALSRSGGVTLPWSADADGTVHDLHLQGDRLYVAGWYSTINGQPRSNLSLLDRVSGAVSPWAPNPDSQVSGVGAHASGIYAGGYFTSIGGGSRWFLGSVGTYDGLASPWNPEASNGGVEALLVSGDRLFVGGRFGFMGLQPRAGIAAFTLPQGQEVALQARVRLEGPYDSDTGLMGDALRTAGLLPITEPYTALGVAHSGGGSEFTTPTVLAAAGSDAIVDWVLLELRASGNNATVVATRSALLQRDGDIVEVDGRSPVTFAAPPGDYYVAVRHRNHLGCMAALPVSLSASSTPLDLSDPGTATYGTAARKSITGAFPVHALWAGDVTFNGLLQYVGENNDRDPILVTIGGSVPTNTATGYLNDDVNLDGVVRYVGEDNDRDPILVNIGGSVPTSTRAAQLP